MNKTKAILLTSLVFLALTVVLVKAADVDINWNVNDGSTEIVTQMSAGWATDPGYETAIKGADFLLIDANSSTGSQHYTSHMAGSETAWISLDRHVEIENGVIIAVTERDNTWWLVDTDYYAYLATDGDGVLDQSFYNQYDLATMDTYLGADCDYDMAAGEIGLVHGNFTFAMAGIGDGKADLVLSLTDFSGYYWRNAFGDFYFSGDCDAAFIASGENSLDLDGAINVDGVLTTFDVDVDGGEFGPISGSGDEVEFGGHIDEMN